MNAQKWFDFNFMKMTVLAVMVIFSSTSSQNYPAIYDTVNGWRVAHVAATITDSNLTRTFFSGDTQYFGVAGNTKFMNGANYVLVNYYKDFQDNIPVGEVVRVKIKVNPMENVDRAYISLSMQDDFRYIVAGGTFLPCSNQWVWVCWNIDSLEFLGIDIPDYFKLFYLPIILGTTGPMYVWGEIAFDSLLTIFENGDTLFYDHFMNNPTSVKEDKLVSTFRLEQNYPNPFNSSTKINYSLTERCFVSLIVYDMIGREIAVLVKEEKESGDHEASFDAYGLSAGVYLYRLKVGNFVEAKKMILNK